MNASIYLTKIQKIFETTKFFMPKNAAILLTERDFSLSPGVLANVGKCRGKGREKAHNQKIGIFRKGRIKKLIKIGKIESSLVSLKNVNDDSGLLE